MNTELPIEKTAEPTLARHRRGHVARLPKPLRDKVNSMLDDGAEYTAIIAELQKSTNPPLPHSVNEDNIGNWKKGGYQDYLRNRDWTDQLRDRQEKFLDATDNDPVKLADAGMQIAATGLCELLDELARPQSKGENASDRYARITNSMSRLARVILSFAQRRDALAKEKAAELPKRDPNKPFGDDNDHRAVVDIIDRVLGLGKYHRPRNTPPAGVVFTAGARRPVSDQPMPTAAPEQTTNDRSQISDLRSEIPTKVSPQQTEPTINADVVPAPPTEQIDDRPWNWNELSEEAVAQWRQQRKANRAPSSSNHATVESAPVTLSSSGGESRREEAFPSTTNIGPRPIARPNTHQLCNL